MSFHARLEPRDDDFYETFDPDSYEGGVICHVCDEPLTRANVFREEVEPQVYILLCVTCAVQGREK